MIGRTETALFNGDEQLTPWGPSDRVIGKLDKPVTRMLLRYDTDMLEIPTYIAANTEIRLGRAAPLPDEHPDSEWHRKDAEDTLIGLVCDQLDRANPDLPIEDCQAIARDIIALVRERT